jgi:murein DD-endopeptidase MepM/ murein hydrolase activator NlpD
LGKGKVIPILFFLFALAAFLTAPEKAAGGEYSFQAEVLPKLVKQGEVCFLKTRGPISFKSVYGEFQGKRYPLGLGDNNQDYEGLLGIDMDTKPEKYGIRFIAMGGSGQVDSKTISIKVEKAEFAVQKITLPRSMVELDPKTLERANRESKRLKELFQKFGNERTWKGSFIRPVEGELSGAFGTRRIINGQPKSPHTGVDLRAEEGTPVRASNNGRVALVDDLFFSGKSVILDHGWGLYSMYFHLSETRVREGDRIYKGAELGQVGSTGRSTGPHLHWGIILNGARVDPFSLLRSTASVQ